MLKHQRNALNAVLHHISNSNSNRIVLNGAASPMTFCGNCLFTICIRVTFDCEMQTRWTSVGIAECWVCVLVREERKINAQMLVARVPVPMVLMHNFAQKPTSVAAVCTMRAHTHIHPHRHTEVEK